MSSNPYGDIHGNNDDAPDGDLSEYDDYCTRVDSSDDEEGDKEDIWSLIEEKQTFFV